MYRYVYRYQCIKKMLNLNANLLKEADLHLNSAFFCWCNNGVYFLLFQGVYFDKIQGEVSIIGLFPIGWHTKLDKILKFNYWWKCNFCIRKIGIRNLLIPNYKAWSIPEIFHSSIKWWTKKSIEYKINLNIENNKGLCIRKNTFDWPSLQYCIFIAL